MSVYIYRICGCSLDVTLMFRGDCKACPKKLTTCSMGSRQCTDCRPFDECNTATSKNAVIETTAAAQRRQRRFRTHRRRPNMKHKKV